MNVPRIEGQGALHSPYREPNRKVEKIEKIQANRPTADPHASDDKGQDSVGRKLVDQSPFGDTVELTIPDKEETGSPETNQS